MRPRASFSNAGIASRKTVNRGISVPTRFGERKRGRTAPAGEILPDGDAPPCILFQRRSRIAQDGKLWNFRSDAIWRKEARPRCVGRGQLYRRGCAPVHPLSTSESHRARRQTGKFPFQRDLAKESAAALRRPGPTLPEGMRLWISSSNFQRRKHRHARSKARPSARPDLCPHTRRPGRSLLRQWPPHYWPSQPEGWPDLPLSRTMLTGIFPAYVGRFACDWHRLAITDAGGRAFSLYRESGHFVNHAARRSSRALKRRSM